MCELGSQKLSSQNFGSQKLGSRTLFVNMKKILNYVPWINSHPFFVALSRAGPFAHGHHQIIYSKLNFLQIEINKE